MKQQPKENVDKTIGSEWENNRQDSLKLIRELIKSHIDDFEVTYVSISFSVEEQKGLQVYIGYSESM